MRAARVVRLIAVAAVAAVLALLVRVLRGRPAPVFLEPPSAPSGLLRPEVNPVPTGDEHPPDEVGGAGPGAGPADDQTPEADDPVDVDPTDVDGSEMASTEVASASVRWVLPVDGACPPGHQIKAKLRSGLFHEPGMAMYDRTHPDRCYATAADAEADGLRRARR